jgi:hypothetical protein
MWCRYSKVQSVIIARSYEVCKTVLQFIVVPLGE